MKIPHFAGAPNQLVDEIFVSKPYSELSTKIGYTLYLKKVESAIELYSGIKNIFNSYQNNFDIGKNRDSNFVYGPSLPRTFYLGIKLKSK
jgi:outer membrane receptor for ferrienterochelin and colicins